MPLIIIALAIIVAVSWASRFSKESARTQFNNKMAIRRTNARMERVLVDKYMKYGWSFDAAYELARADLMEMGFEACIPKTAYMDRDEYNRYCNGEPVSPRTSGIACGHWSVKSSCLDYDSEGVQKLREDYRKICKNRRVRCTLLKEQEYIYTHLPGKATSSPLVLSSQQYNVVPVGGFLFHKTYGTCEVVALEDECNAGTVRVVKTGERVRIIFNGQDYERIY